MDSLGQSVNLKLIKIIVDESIELTPKLKDSKISSLKLTSGQHSIQIQTEKFKTVLITDVKIYEHKLSFIEITLKAKTSEKDTSIIKLKYKQPKKTICN